MGAKTGISWTDSTWTPLRARVRSDAEQIAVAKGYTSLVTIGRDMAGRVGPHCEHVSHGCDNCYAESNNGRCLTANGTGLPFDRRARDLVEPFVDEKILEWPLRWKKPRKIFVCSQTDLFGEWVTDEAIDQVFAVMALCPQHVFQVLTKRPERMLKYFAKPQGFSFTWREGYIQNAAYKLKPDAHFALTRWPLPNVWLGISCEDQKTADERTQYLRITPAEIRFISQEPQISNIQWTPDMLHGISWHIIGGESGRGARPFDIQWARDTIAVDRLANVAPFVKQLGSRPMVILGGPQNFYLNFTGAAKDPLEWPEDLRIQNFPL